jgi:predicted nucleotidyltransferase
LAKPTAQGRFNRYKSIKSLGINKKTVSLRGQKLTTMDKRADIIDKIRIYKELVKTSFPVNVEQVYLFGSYAKGTSHKDSDIDVALIVEHLDENYSILHTEPLLWDLCEQVDYRIEPHVIARDADYAGFLDEIQRTGVEI